MNIMNEAMASPLSPGYEKDWRAFESTGLNHSKAHYLLALAGLQREERRTKAVDLSQRLGLTRAAVSLQLKTLVREGLVMVQKDQALFLTQKGSAAVESLLHRREIFHAFLTNVLGVSEATAQRDSCMVEHLLSGETSDALFQFVQRYRNDPPLTHKGKDRGCPIRKWLGLRPSLLVLALITLLLAFPALFISNAKAHTDDDRRYTLGNSAPRLRPLQSRRSQGGADNTPPGSPSHSCQHNHSGSSGGAHQNCDHHHGPLSVEDAERDFAELTAFRQTWSQQTSVNGSQPYWIVKTEASASNPKGYRFYFDDTMSQMITSALGSFETQMVRSCGTACSTTIVAEARGEFQTRSRRWLQTLARFGLEVSGDFIYYLKQDGAPFAVTYLTLEVLEHTLLTPFIGVPLCKLLLAAYVKVADPIRGLWGMGTSRIGGEFAPLKRIPLFFSAWGLIRRFESEMSRILKLDEKAKTALQKARQPSLVRRLLDKTHLWILGRTEDSLMSQEAEIHPPRPPSSQQTASWEQDLDLILDPRGTVAERVSRVRILEEHFRFQQSLSMEFGFLQVLELKSMKALEFIKLRKLQGQMGAAWRSLQHLLLISAQTSFSQDVKTQLTKDFKDILDEFHLLFTSSTPVLSRKWTDLSAEDKSMFFSNFELHTTLLEMRIKGLSRGQTRGRDSEIGFCESELLAMGIPPQKP